LGPSGDAARQPSAAMAGACMMQSSVVQLYFSKL
jgi:hypothetical protein